MILLQRPFIYAIEGGHYALADELLPDQVIKFVSFPSKTSYSFYLSLSFLWDTLIQNLNQYFSELIMKDNCISILRYLGTKQGNGYDINYLTEVIKKIDSKN